MGFNPTLCVDHPGDNVGHSLLPRETRANDVSVSQLPYPGYVGRTPHRAREPFQAIIVS